MTTGVRNQAMFLLVLLSLALSTSYAIAGPAVLRVTSEPEGAAVRVRQAAHAERFDEDMGVTPIDITITTVTTRPRRFVVTLSLEGYHSAQRVVELSTNTEESVHVVLTPSDQPPPQAGRAAPPTEEPRPAAPTRQRAFAPRAEGRAEAPAESEPRETSGFSDESESVPPTPLTEAELAFYRAGGLYVAQADGTGETRVADVGRSGARIAPAWSPDGATLAYADRGDLYVINDQAPQRVLRATDLNPSRTYWHSYTPRIESPVWSPDGSQLAFLHYTRDGFANLYTAQPSGSGPLMVAELVDGPPAWHPTLPLIAVPQPGSVMIYDVRRAPRGPALAVLPGASEPAWSPDGAWLATVAEGAVWVCDPVGRGRRTVLAREGLRARRPRWFRDSQRLLSVVEVGKPTGSKWEEIWMCHLTPDREPEIIADANSQPGVLRTIDLAGLSRDGSAAIYGLGRNPTTYYLQPLDGGERTMLLQGAERPAWFWRNPRPAEEGSAPDTR